MSTSPPSSEAKNETVGGEDAEGNKVEEFLKQKPATLGFDQYSKGDSIRMTWAYH